MPRLRILLAVISICLVAALIVLIADPAVAAPGGKIVSGLFRTFWGKMFLGALTVIFLPLILWVVWKERMGTQRTMADLKRLAAVYPEFDWMRLKERTVECFNRVHDAWRREEMERACQWMTPWYWQNQQMAHLDRWHEQGLVNVCTVKSIGAIKPLFVHYAEGEGSRVVVSITANMEDYLMERASGRVVEGAKGYTDAEFVWTFAYEDGQWRVSMIEEGSLSLTYADLANEVPAVVAPRATGVVAR